MKYRRPKQISSSLCTSEFTNEILSQKPRKYRLAVNLMLNQYNKLWKTPCVNSFTIDRELKSQYNRKKDKLSIINTLIKMNLRRLHVKSVSSKDEQVVDPLQSKNCNNSYDLYTLSDLTNEAHELINSIKETPNNHTAKTNEFLSTEGRLNRRVRQKSMTVNKNYNSLPLRKSVDMPKWFNNIMKEVNDDNKPSIRIDKLMRSNINYGIFIFIKP